MPWDISGVGITLVTHPATARRHSRIPARGRTYDAAALRRAIGLRRDGLLGQSSCFPARSRSGARPSRKASPRRSRSVQAVLHEPRPRRPVDAPAAPHLHAAGICLRGRRRHDGARRHQVGVRPERGRGHAFRSPDRRPGTRRRAHPATEAHPRALPHGCADLSRQAELSAEIFGPASIAVSCASRPEMVRLARGLHGHLTATIHGTEKDLADFSELVGVLRRKAGRLIFNGFPTGVEVCHAMHHGGPYPATTDARETSVGSRSIASPARSATRTFRSRRCLRSSATRTPWGIWRLIDGAPSRSHCSRATTNGFRDDRGRRLAHRGEPTRVVVSGWPELASPTMEGRREELATRFEDLWRRSPRAPRPRRHRRSAPDASGEPRLRGRRRLFDNGPALDVRARHDRSRPTLEHLGRIGPGKASRHGRGDRGRRAAVDGLVTIENVPARCLAKDVAGGARPRPGGRRRRLRRQLVLSRATASSAWIRATSSAFRARRSIQRALATRA
jgi:hypothetical protein